LREAGRGGTRRLDAGGLEHLGDRRDPRDGLLAEGEGIRHGAHELAVDEDRAAAHARDDAGLSQGPAFQPGQDHALLRADGVVEHAQDPNVELVDPGPFEDRSTGALHSGADVIDAQQLACPCARTRQGERENDAREPAMTHTRPC